MWDEIMDMPGEIFDIDDRDCMPLDMQEDIEQDDPLLWREDTFEAIVEQMCNDPEFIAAVERNNAEWDAAVAEDT